MGHTPEPWKYLPPQAVGGAAIIPSSGPAICSFWNEQPDLRTEEEHEANARRIVACVNACEGINPEAVPDLLAACREGLSFMESVIEFNEMRGNITPPDVIELRDRFAAAIAEARGEA